MATHALGKLKFNVSKEGLAFRWGEGKIRHVLGKRAATDDDNVEEYLDGEDEFADPGYDDGGDYADDPNYDDRRNDGGYDDGYADDDGYRNDGGYADDGYADDGDYADDGYDAGYADDGYDDDGYADDGYADDAGYDDGYDDDGYADDGYDDGYDDDGYDDRYSDADAGDGYAQDYPENASPLMQYVEENDWVTYLLLFLFPPLGIYLLWRRAKFDKPVRYAVSAASAIWFVVALALIFTSLFGAPQDNTQDATITLAPSITLAPEATEPADGGLDLTVDTAPEGGATATAIPGGITDTEPTVEPSPTPLTGGSGGATAGLSGASYVYSPATGLYYHSRSDCTNIDEGVSVTRVPKDVAENNRKQSACPVCIGTGENGDTTTYYATRTGTYYHTDKTCQGMTGATTYTKEAAEKAGKTPCPVCVLKTAASLKTGDVKFINSNTKDKSKISVYTTKNGKYYHMTPNCSGMMGATRGSLKDALLAGKGACPTCCKAAGTSVYCTKDGQFYHTDKTCSGMKDALEVTLAEALVLGKTRCHTCVKSGSLPTASQLQQAASTGDDGTYVYGTANGKYYHTDANCSGMKDAQRYTLKSMLLQNRKACPKCASAADTVVYATKSGKYYHSYATCSGMTTATEATMAEAISQGYKRCPKCWSESTSMAKARGHVDESADDSGSGTKASSNAASAPSATATASNTYVYATKAGAYYHLTSNCSGMKGASRITLKQAINAGKKACPNCAGSSKRTVYSTDGGKYYHAASECKPSGMKGGTAKTLAKALMLGQTACKYCIGKTASTSSKSGNTASSGTTTVSTKTQESIKKAAAKLVNSHTYKSGKSGIKVYARADGKYYHSKSDCSGLTGASRLTLETAMNYGKKACPKCMSAASKKVYSSSGDKYYHYYKAHAGSNAKAGTLAQARAMGKKLCSQCSKAAAAGVSGASSAASVDFSSFKSAEGSTVHYSAPADTNVYVDLEGDSPSYYYHKSSYCSGKGMKHGTAVKLGYVKEWDYYKACPYCNPPTSVS